MTTIENPTTTQVLADVQQCVLLWKSPELLAIAVAVVKFFVENVGPHFLDEIDLSFVRDEDKNLTGNCLLILKRRGILAMTDHWRRSTKPQSKCRVVWQYRLASLSLAREFLRRNHAPMVERQETLL
jgi:hypothetical protein